MTPIDHHPPYPRLWHCRPGSVVQLRGETQLRQIEDIDGDYAIFNGGRLAVGLSHMVNQVYRVPAGSGWKDTDRELMTFGYGGWQPK